MDDTFCDWLINEFRFLDWDNNLRSWIVMKSKKVITRKVSKSIYNAGRKRAVKLAMLRYQQARSNNRPEVTSSIEDNFHDSALEDAEDMSTYIFLEARRQPYQQSCWDSDTIPVENQRGNRKRTRVDS